MAQLLVVHPVNPQVRLLRQAAQIIDHGGLAAVPTDSCYALVCHLDDKPAVDRLRRIRQIDERHHLTLMCRDLSEIANYARVDNLQYRLLKNATPGPYTFILEATKEVPRRLSHPSRKTIGIRVPEHPVTLALLEVFGQPLISSTLQLPGDEIPLNDAAHIVERIGHELDVVIDGGACGVEPTTIVDVTGRQAVLVRRGRGPVEALGLQ
ncbi:MAG: threonylcarbamoyl-AMP synthase [Burkholderiales bacterium]|jgi:tRNA threonylcarbamoyl adenosine modification protein (Sua5/YciO/YrdC/YwlC family)|nr:threonylcarbamoyl-AMP synthase [Burkholderiales bacterium]MCA3222385.1 threonylcarbamoyl-AMP synthase [Burkholderiales bacterium]MCA3227103.1 threonylcarbamoyl-AMP synthase [Burkholderiales bacterium]MCA3229062.1 threonylcarbamoyl-AMP synthase [Burkholderiales bacterium]MCE2645782.1 threonylcarbamoyl-AMP synthase [Burkholderiaceae bacterium]